MSELNFRPATGDGLAGDKSVAVPALNAGALGGSARFTAQARQQRRRLSSTRFQLEDTGFRLFRVF